MPFLRRIFCAEASVQTAHWTSRKRRIVILRLLWYYFINFRFRHPSKRFFFFKFRFPFWIQDVKLVDKPALQRHMFLHTGQKKHKCIFCAKAFFTRISQKRHERNVHTKEKSHCCPYCDKKFVMRKFLERHLNTHTAEIVYQCDQCDKKFLNKNHLRVHKFRHAKEPPFKCSVCGKAYYDRSSLKQHNYSHIGNPYQCDSCERTFDRRDKYVLSLLLHGNHDL